MTYIRHLKYLFFIMVMANALVIKAQTHSTKETKVVLVTSSKTGSVTHIVPFSTFEKLDREEVEATYPNRQLYVGLLTGTYTLDQNGLRPGSQTSIVMYTNRQIFQEAPFLSKKNFMPGDHITVGNTTARIISSKKGELTLRTH